LYRLLSSAEHSKAIADVRISDEASFAVRPAMNMYCRGMKLYCVLHVFFIDGPATLEELEIIGGNTLF
jgi:hypothetical protein